MFTLKRTTWNFVITSTLYQWWLIYHTDWLQVHTLLLVYEIISVIFPYNELMWFVMSHNNYILHTLVTHYAYKINSNMTFYNLQSSIVMVTGSVMYQFILLDYVFKSYNLKYLVMSTSIIYIQQVSCVISFVMFLCNYCILKKWSCQNWTSQTISYVYVMHHLL